MGETWVNTEMRAKTGIKSWAGLGTGTYARVGDVMEEETVMGTGGGAGVGPRA